MTPAVLEQDVVVYLVLIGVVWFYRLQLRKFGHPSAARRAASAWTRWGHVLATYFMAVGVLYQIGIVPRLPAYALFVIGIFLVFVCLRALRRHIRNTSTVE